MIRIVRESMTTLATLCTYGFPSSAADRPKDICMTLFDPRKNLKAQKK